MGISVSVVMATDEDIKGFQSAPSALESLLNRLFTSSGPHVCHLHDQWDWLNFLISGRAGSAELPVGAIKRGDWSFAGLTDPAHAVHGATTKALLAELDKLSESVLWDRLLQQAGPGSGAIYPGRLWSIRPSDPNSIEFRELVKHFEMFRSFVAEAVKHDKGLIFCRFEDW